MRLRASSLFGAVLFALGCQSDNGGQSGDFSGEDDNEGGVSSGNGCEDLETPIDADDSELGFSPNELLAFVEQGFTAPLAWQAPPNVSYSPGAGSTELMISASATGEAWYVTSEPATSELGGGPLGVICPPPRLRVGVDVEVSTADGALAEAFATTIDASSESFAKLDHHFELDEIAGSFAIESTTPAEGKVLGLTLAATLSPAGTTGSLNSTLEVNYPANDPSGGAVSASPLLFASFPNSASCPVDQSGVSGIPVGIDEPALGLSGEAALELYNAATPVTVRWADGSEAELTLTATAGGEGCVRPNLLGFGESEALVVYPVTLRAASDDGVLDGTYAATLTTSPQPDGDDHRIVIEVSLPLELDELAEAGLADVTLLSGLHRLFFTLSSEVEDGAAHGLLALNGLTDPPCLTDPPEPDPQGMGAPGCQGTEVKKLAGGTWGKGAVD